MSVRVVHLHLGRSVHPVYREQLSAQPEGFTYRGTHPDLLDPDVGTRLIAGQSSRMRALHALVEPVALRAMSRAGYVRRDRVAPLPSAELIHSAEILLRAPQLPYVVDFEQVEVFTLYQHIALSRPWARRALRAAVTDGRCVALLPWSDWARSGLMNAVGPATARAIGGKVVTVLPAIRPAVGRPPARRPGPLRLLFIGTKFFEKGGVEAVLAFQQARATHDATLDLVSYVPPGWRARLAGIRGLTLHRPGGPELVRSLYARSDALLFPSHMDTFGYVVLEANAWGLPVIGPRHLAVPELVLDEVSGLLFEAENPLYGVDGLARFDHLLPPPKAYMAALEQPSGSYVAGIARTIVRLAEDPGLYERLAGRAHHDVTQGRFSMQRRRALLREIYERAVS